MSSRKQPVGPATRDREAPAAANKPLSLEAKVDALTAAVERVADELRVLRNVVDDVREDLQWGVLNDKFKAAPCALHITSMPKNPLAHDFGERLNRFTAKDLPPEPGDESTEASQQNSLF